MDLNYSLSPGKYLSSAEQEYLEALLQRFKATDLRNTTLVLFMLKAGARPQEAVNLTWQDIDFSHRTVFIKTLKGGRDRVIPLKHDLLERFKALSARQPHEPGDRIFPITTRHFSRIWDLYRPVKKKLHSLRHTFAINVYRKSKFNLKLTQILLGHRNLQTTAIYLEIEFSASEARQAIS